MNNFSGPDLNFNQTLIMMKLFIYNKIHNIRSIIFNANFWQTAMAIGIGEINSQGWAWMVDTRVTDTLFVLSFLILLF